MKLSLFFVAILGVAAVSAVPTRGVLDRSDKTLLEHCEDFVGLLDFDALLGVVIQYLADDPEVQKVVEYCMSEDFKGLVIEVVSKTQVQNFKAYLVDAGLPMDDWIQTALDFLGMGSARMATGRITGGIAGFWADIKAVLPMEEIKAMHYEKKETSASWAEIVAIVTGEEARALVLEVLELPEMQSIIENLQAFNFDLAEAVATVKSIFGWN